MKRVVLVLAGPMLALCRAVASARERRVTLGSAVTFGGDLLERYA